MKFIIAFIAVILIHDGAGEGEERRICHYTSRSDDKLRVQQMVTAGDNDEAEYGPGQIVGSQEKCLKSTYHCYAFWREDHTSNNTDGVIYIAQGCWEASGKKDCEANDCISKRRPPKALNNTNFCCCTGDFCNTNASYLYNEEEVEFDPKLEPVEMVRLERVNVALITMLVALGMVSLAVVLVALRIYHSRRSNHGKPGQESVHLMENATHFFNAFNPDDLKLEALIGQGRYGSVWKGSVGDLEVAVKVFPPQHRMYYCNERDTYCLPFMNHSSLLTYLGCDERNGADGSPELLLFLSLAPLGSLQGYLRVNTLDWLTFCKMALSIASGLAHLHTDIKKGDKMKPCLSHRDLNSNNILVKDDLTCVICDLGFATQINGSRYYFNGEEQHAETKSITDVGTLRYMCPEVLEGAVNLRDCETSLKQIDVYALGLVIWELASRCADFFPNGIECGYYRLPFEAEIGHPTLEQMQVLVCRHKARPLFPTLWRDTAAVRTVRETIEDCWDHDAEARLTALCVEERFHELSGFTDRQKGGLYTTGISPIGRGTSLIQKESHNVFVYDEKEHVDDKGGGDSCQSETTVDTILTITPTNPQLNCKNSNQFYGFCPSLQPYQGRNPCLERNLMAARDGDSSSGELIDKSHKHVTIGQVASSVNNPAEYLNIEQQHAQQQQHNHHQQTLVPPRPTLPIPFLQNVSSEPTQPKLSNLIAGAGRKSTWLRIRQAFSGRPSPDGLINNESAVNISTPIEDKLHTKVALSNGKTETRLADFPTEMGVRNNRRPNTLQLSGMNVSSHDSSMEKSNRSINTNTNTVVEEKSSEVEVLESCDPFGSQPGLKDLSSRVKTPGDVPLAVRRARGQKNLARFSLYDDRMMSGCYDNESLYNCPPKTSSNNDGHRSSLDHTQFTQNI